MHPLAPILISSFTLSSNAITFLCAIPVLLGDDALLGTAMGVWKAFQNANSTIMDVAAGAIVSCPERHPLTSQQDKSSNDSYNAVIYFIIAIKCVEFILGPIYDYLDGRWLGHSLRMPEQKRVAFRAKAVESELDLPGWRVNKKVLYFVLAQLTCMIIVAYVVSTASGVCQRLTTDLHPLFFGLLMGYERSYVAQLSMYHLNRVVRSMYD